MDQPLRVAGYHGTSADSVRSIEENGFELSRKKTDWLGDGVYFWQDAPFRAWHWALRKFSSRPAVFECVIRLEHCIDLFDMPWAEELRSLVPLFMERFEADLPEQSGGANRRDRLFFNFVVGNLRDQGMDIKAIRSVFIEGEPMFAQSAIYDLSHVQIAVLDTSIIESASRLEDPQDLSREGGR